MHRRMLINKTSKRLRSRSLLLEPPRWVRLSLQIGPRKRFIPASWVGGLRILLQKRQVRIGPVAATKVMPSPRRKRAAHQTTLPRCLEMLLFRENNSMDLWTAHKQWGETPFTIQWSSRRGKSCPLAGRRYTIESSKERKSSKMPCFLIQDSEALRCYRIPSMSRHWLILWRRRSGKRPDLSNRRRIHPTSITWATRSFRMSPRVLLIKISEEAATTPAFSKILLRLLRRRYISPLRKLNQQRVWNRQLIPTEVRVSQDFLLVAELTRVLRNPTSHRPGGAPTNRRNRRPRPPPRWEELVKASLCCPRALLRKMVKLRKHPNLATAVHYPPTKVIPRRDKSLIWTIDPRRWRRSKRKARQAARRAHAKKHSPHWIIHFTRLHLKEAIIHRSLETSK